MENAPGVGGRRVQNEGPVSAWAPCEVARRGNYLSAPWARVLYALSGDRSMLELTGTRRKDKTSGVNTEMHIKPIYSVDYVFQYPVLSRGTWDVGRGTWEALADRRPPSADRRNAVWRKLKHRQIYQI